MAKPDAVHGLLRWPAPRDAAQPPSVPAGPSRTAVTFYLPLADDWEIAIGRHRRDHRTGLRPNLQARMSIGYRHPGDGRLGIWVRQHSLASASPPTPLALAFLLGGTSAGGWTPSSSVATTDLLLTYWCRSRDLVLDLPFGRPILSPADTVRRRPLTPVLSTKRSPAQVENPGESAPVRLSVGLPLPSPGPTIRPCPDVRPPTASTTPAELPSSAGSPRSAAYPRERPEALVAAWEAEGDSRGLERMTAGFWDAGTAWMFEQLGARR